MGSDHIEEKSVIQSIKIEKIIPVIGFFRVFYTVSENANLSHEFKIIVLIAINHLILESKDRINGTFFFYVLTTPTKIVLWG